MGVEYAVILLAAGSGRRMHTATKKQYLSIHGKPMMYYPLRAIEESNAAEVILVVSPGEEAYVQDEIIGRFRFKKKITVVAGGAERYASVEQGLSAVSAPFVLVHDAARCMVTKELFEKAAKAVGEYDAAVVAVPSVDTVKIADEDGFVHHTPPRNAVWSIQTPQAFATSLLLQAYGVLHERTDGFCGITDDAMVVERAFPEKRIKLIEGSYENTKVTTPEDLAIAKERLEG